MTEIVLIFKENRCRLKAAPQFKPLTFCLTFLDRQLILKEIFYGYTDCLYPVRS